MFYGGKLCVVWALVQLSLLLVGAAWAVECPAVDWTQQPCYCPDGTVLCGDYNGDGCLTAEDLPVIPFFFESNFCCGSPFYIPCWDCDGDGCTNFNDLALFSAKYGMCFCPCTQSDFNNDNAVNWLDLSPFSTAYGSCSGTPNYRRRLDFNNDGVIDWLDIGPFSSCYGLSW